MDGFDTGLPRLILDGVKTIDSLLANHRKKAPVSSLSAPTVEQVPHFVVDASNNSSMENSDEHSSSQFIQTNVMIERATVINVGSPTAPKSQATPLRAEIASSEDNARILASLSDDVQDEGKRKLPSIISGYAESVAMKRLKKGEDCQ